MDRERCYILKELFLHNLNIHEFRLCVFLTTFKDKTLGTMSFSDKMWCVKERKNELKNLENYIEKLKELNLIQDNGFGLSLENREFCIVNSEDIYKCKTVREIFALCLNYWYKNGTFISVKKEYVYNVFGDVPKRRNQNIKLLKESTGIDFTLEERENDFLFHKPLKKMSKEKKQKLEIGESFELYCGKELEEQGYKVIYNGIDKGIADGGIDLIATKDDIIKYIQCKYWNKNTKIRENVIAQMYGSSLSLAIESGISMEEFVKKLKQDKIQMFILTHTTLSKEAFDFANRLNIKFTIDKNIKV